MDTATLSSSRPDNFIEDVNTPKTLAMLDLLRNAGCRPKRMLVVGCGTGSEAGIFARAFGAETVGIDLATEFTFDRDSAAPATLMQMDAREMSFEDKSFDAVYSFHALEHIPRPEAALREMARVLRPGGHFLAGTPNKARLIGYFAAPHPLVDRISMNFRDLGMRLRGRWSNEAGAHAGFTSGELTAMCREAFGDGRDVSEEYYSRLYSSKAKWVGWVGRSGLRDVIFPCVYVLGTRQT